MLLPVSASRRKRIAFYSLALSFSLALSLLILEIGSRWIEARRRAEPAGTRMVGLLVENPRGTGSYRLQPDYRRIARIGGREIRVSTNRHGMPWREVSVKRTDRRRRIAFVGDSFTFGCWADSYEEAFVGVFDRSVSPERFEVLNFGVGGYGLSDVELQIQEQVMAFSPTFVIAVVFTGNDFRDTLLGLDKEDLVDGTARLNDANLRARVPEESLGFDGTLSEACDRESALLRGLDELASFRLLSPFLGLENLCVDFAVNQNFRMYTYWSQYPYPELAMKGKDAVLSTLERIDRDLEARDLRLAVVALPMMEQVHARAPVGEDYDIELPQAYLRLFARERGIPYIDLLPVLRAHVQRTNERLYLAGDTHLNNRGHELVGEALADWFRCCVKTRRPSEPIASR
jgi:lysophospholipase L1-like esterase